MERLKRELSVSLYFNQLHLFLQAVNCELSAAKKSLDTKEKELRVMTESLRTAEDEIDEYKKLLQVAKDMKRKSISWLNKDQQKEMDNEKEVPDGCKTS